MIECLELYKTSKALLLGALRILRCNPLFKGGFDPVPIPKGLRVGPKELILKMQLKNIQRTSK